MLWLFGAATNDKDLENRGRVLAAMELRSAKQYWQIIPYKRGSASYGLPFDKNGCVGVLWSTKVDYATWFGAKDEYIHGIQMLPFTPYSEYLITDDWMQYTLSQSPLAQRLASRDIEEPWKGLIIMAEATINKEKAWEKVWALTKFDNGNSLSNMLYWIATRPPSRYQSRHQG